MTFFFLSKFSALFIQPSHILVWLVLAFIAAYILNRKRLAICLAFAFSALFILIGLIPAWILPTRALENMYPRGASPAHVDGIMVLGGGLDTSTLLSRGVPHPEISETRLVAGFELARHYPNARLVFSGGGAPRAPETVTARYIYRQMGLPEERLVLEPRARDTQENILFSGQLVKPKPGEVWMMVTSALHMPRAMETSKRAQWTMTPWPSDYLTGDDSGRYFFNVSKNMAATDAVSHEYLGLLAYRFRATMPAQRGSHLSQ